MVFFKGAKLVKKNVLLQTDSAKTMKITAKEDASLRDLLKGFFSETSGEKIKKMIMYGCISYRGAVVKSPEMIIRKGDFVEYTKYVGGSGIAKQKTDLPIVYEDRDLVVVNKSGGLRLESKVSFKGKTVCSMTRSYLRRKYKGSQPLFTVCHVDDQEAGLCVLARNKSAADRLSAAWREIEKEYLCIVQNPLKYASRTISNYKIESSFGKNECPIQKNETPFRASETPFHGDERGIHNTLSLKYREQERFDVGEKTLCVVRVRVQEGETKDVRAFFAKLGSPVVADFVYGNKDFADNFLKICLVGIRFSHPATGATVSLNIEAPKGFASVNIKR